MSSSKSVYCADQNSSKAMGENEDLNGERVGAEVSSVERARQEIARLVEKYRRLDARAIRAYNEANTRKDYILPLFRALGWDVHDSAEVSAEDKVSRGRVDLAFRLDGIPKFFLEAKRLATDLEDPKWARQVINYAWIKGVSWAVLTDFEGLKVFNAEWKERNPRLNIFLNIFIDLTYEQYLDEFDRLWLLAKEAMAESLIDREALRVGKKLKKSPVGDQLFAELVRWREKLHHYLRLYNPEFADAQIDEAVQHILDRLVFIRTCEDREIEPVTLRALLREWRNGGRRKDLVRLLSGAFRDFDEGYDAQLFAPHFSERLSCEPGPFEEVIKGLYATPDGIIEYDFNAIDVDVLGGIYEQYLGYVTKVVERREKREEPLAVEVIERKGWRKKHGIYYTPQFVVRYIVANTLGRLLEERSYDEVKELKVLDPACGSGSFLIKAFDLLDRYHRRVRGDYDEAEILTSNIYGVDLDAQAVEIARLNLLLKTLTQRAQLPDLTNNIRQGNSLISGTPEELREHFGESWEEKHPFDWDEEFPQIMAAGGFDVLIGNPPYIRAERMAKDERTYWQKSGQFASIYGRFDIHILFVERALKMLKEGGRLGFIIPNAALNQNYAKKLRKLILDTCCIESIVDLSNYKVFQEAAVATCIVILRKESDETMRERNRVRIVRQDDYSTGINPSEDDSYLISQPIFWETPYTSFRLELREPVLQVIDKIAARGLTLGDLCYIITGAVLHNPCTGASKERLIHTKDAPGLKPYIEAKEVARYVPPVSTRFLDYVAHDVHRPKFAQLFQNEKLMICRIASKVVATYDDQHLYTDHTLDLAVRKDKLQHVRRRDLKVSDEEAGLARQYHLFYLLGLINSRVATFYLRMILGMAIEINPETARRLPICRIDFDNPEEKKMHDDLVALVQRMLELNGRLVDAAGRGRQELDRKIERTDRAIDELVYELYGLTEQERKEVEG